MSRLFTWYCVVKAFYTLLHPRARSRLFVIASTATAAAQGFHINPPSRDLQRPSKTFFLCASHCICSTTITDQSTSHTNSNMCGSDIFLGLVAILFPPLAVWVKRGICSADSLINIALCSKSAVLPTASLSRSNKVYSARIPPRPLPRLVHHRIITRSHLRARRRSRARERQCDLLLRPRPATVCACWSAHSPTRIRHRQQQRTERTIPWPTERLCRTLCAYTG